MCLEENIHNLRYTSFKKKAAKDIYRKEDCTNIGKGIQKTTAGEVCKKGELYENTWFETRNRTTS